MYATHQTHILVCHTMSCRYGSQEYTNLTGGHHWIQHDAGAVQTRLRARSACGSQVQGWNMHTHHGGCGGKDQHMHGYHHAQAQRARAWAQAEEPVQFIQHHSRLAATSPYRRTHAHAPSSAWPATAATCTASTRARARPSRINDAGMRCNVTACVTACPQLLVLPVSTSVRAQRAVAFCC